jgi:hypothetical protein
MKEYNIIFLDIDGVMNSVQYDCWRQNKKLNRLRYGSIDPREYYRMAKFCEDNNVKLVISSSWRNGNSWEQNNEDFLRDGNCLGEFHLHGLEILAPYIVGVTPYSKSRHRGQEIQYFIDITNGKYPEYRKIMKEDFTILNYCIVDDDNDMLDIQKKNFVQTNSWTGITRKNYHKIKEILKL